jgi:hypothetical protein
VLYRRKPETVQAWQYMGGRIPKEAPQWVWDRAHDVPIDEDRWYLLVFTGYGDVVCEEGEWLILDSGYDIYVVSNEKFQTLFEVVNEAHS